MWEKWHTAIVAAEIWADLVVNVGNPLHAGYEADKRGELPWNLAETLLEAQNKSITNVWLGGGDSAEPGFL